MTHTDPLALPPEHDPEPGWGQSLSTGAAGLTLLHIAYAHAGVSGWDTAHQWVAAMTRSPVAAHPDACLFTGAPAVAFVLRAADQPAYAAELSTLDSHITALTLCHGWAGLVQTTRRAAADAGPDSALAALLPHLHTRFAQRLHRHRPTTCDGLLEGAAGIELTRHTTADVLPAARWDACLLIAPPILREIADGKESE